MVRLDEFKKVGGAQMCFSGAERILKVKCIHAVGTGVIDFSEVGDVKNHGALGFSGDIVLYSPKNFNGSDLSAMMTQLAGWETCPAM